MHNTAPRGKTLPKPIEDNQQLSGRCHYCGYSLKGLGKQGNCPECGTDYTEESASRLKPRPGALVICIRIGWPLFIVIGLYIYAFLSEDEVDSRIIFVLFPMFVAVPINAYYQVRSMLKKHLPEQKRTQGFIAGLRAIGSLVALALTVFFILLYLLSFIFFLLFFNK